MRTTPAEPGEHVWTYSSVDNEAEYIIAIDGYSQEVWPASFKFTPMKGDSVISDSGRRLKIIGIIHSKDGVIIELSRELGGSEATTGGGVGKKGPLEY